MSSDISRDYIADAIKKHEVWARNMLDGVWTVLGSFFVLVALYILPDVCERYEPKLRANIEKKISDYNSCVSSYEKKYGIKFSRVSSGEYDKQKERGELNEKINDAYFCSEKNGESVSFSIFFAEVLSFVSYFKPESNKIKMVLDLYPIMFVAIISGFLLTYRMHIRVVKEFTDKMISSKGESKKNI